MGFVCFYHNTRDSSTVFPLGKLTFVHCNILTLQLPHFLYLIEIDHEAFLISVVHLDALSTKDRTMIRTVEMHYALIVRDAELVFYGFWALVVEIDRAQKWISFNNLIEDVNI